jgi:transcriptional regulator with XRE-family HTH domain
MHAKKFEKKSKHVLAFVREAIGLKQSEVASLAGISTDAIRSIEIHRLALSERVAFLIEQQLGVRAKWLLDDELGSPPPDPAEIARRFNEVQTHPWGNTYIAHQMPRMLFFRSYVIAREVANELGGPGALQQTGFVDALVKLNEALFACLPDVQTRRKVYKKATAKWNEGPRQVCRLVASDAIETGRAMEENKAQSEAAVKWMAEHTPEQKMAQAREHMAAHARSRLYARTGKRQKRD